MPFSGSFVADASRAETANIMSNAQTREGGGQEGRGRKGAGRRGGEGRGLGGRALCDENVNQYLLRGTRKDLIVIKQLSSCVEFKHRTWVWR